MEARQLKDDAAEHFRKGRFSKAAELYLQLTKLDPKEPQHLIKLGDSYRRDGKKEPAVEAYRTAVDAYAKLGVMIKAIAACKLVLEIDATQKDAQEALAALCAKRYVRRPDGPVSPPSGIMSRKPASRQEPIEPLDLPETSSPLEIEGREALEQNFPVSPPSRPSIAPMSRPSMAPFSRPPVSPSSRAPASRPPVVDFSPPAKQSITGRQLPPQKRVEPEAIEFDESPEVPPVEEKEQTPPQDIELDLDMSADEPAPAAKPKPKAKPQTEPEDIAIDVGEMSDIALDAAIAQAGGEEPDLPDEALIIEPETDEEHEVMRVAASAARRPVTAMAGIIAEASRHDDEIEVFAVSTGDDEGEVVEAEPGSEIDEPTSAVDPSEFAQADAEPAADEAPPEPQPAPAPSLDDYLAIGPDGEQAGTPVTSPVPLVTPPPIDRVEVTDLSAGTLTLEVDQSQVPLFSELPPDAFVELLERLSFTRVAAGEEIIREGDVGKSIFILATGRAKVVKGHGSRSVLELATLEEGAFFGEMALLNGSPRVASVIAADDCEVLELTEEILRDLTKRHPSVGQSLKKFYRQRLLQNVMAISPLFKAFDKPDRKSLVEKFKVREVKTNEPIISEGQATDGLFVIMHGAALVQMRDESHTRNVPLAVLKEGDVFGEMSLLTHRPATATVIAKRRTIVLRLPKPVFDELMFTHPAMLEVVSELSDQRTKVNEAILAGTVAAPRDALAFL